MCICLYKKYGTHTKKHDTCDETGMAHIFALWTSLNSEYYFDALKKKSASDPKSYLKNNHNQHKCCQFYDC